MLICLMTETLRVKVNRPTVLNHMLPSFLPILRRVHETANVVTLDIAAPNITPATPLYFKPGQFNMLYAFGIGEVPISISGDPAITDRIVHTIRSVGLVSEALTKLKPNELVGIRGPFGSCWPVEEASGYDVLVIASGIGLVPMRPVLYHLLRYRERYGRIALLYGARYREDLLFLSELERWRRTPDFQVRVTLSRAGTDWTGDVGHVMNLLPKVRFDPVDTIAMICGPEVMIRSASLAVENIGISSNQIFVSMERNMKCAIGTCGHCQFGPHFICKDGPIFRYDRIRNILNLREI